MTPPELKINEIAMMNQADVGLVLDGHPEIVEDVCLMLANGGSLITAAQKLGVPYSRLSVWLNADEDRRERVRLAVEARDEWLVHRITLELQDMGLLNTREIYNDDGTLKAIKDIPDHVLKCVQGIDVIETSDKDGTVSQIKRLRFTDKQKALEMLGRNLEKFIERKKLVVEGGITVQAFDLEERLKMIDIAPEKQTNMEVAIGRIEADVAPVKPDTGVVDL